MHALLQLHWPVMALGREPPKPLLTLPPGPCWSPLPVNPPQGQMTQVRSPTAGGPSASGAAGGAGHLLCAMNSCWELLRSSSLQGSWQLDQA